MIDIQKILTDGFVSIPIDSKWNDIKNHFNLLFEQADYNKDKDDRSGLVKIRNSQRFFYYLENRENLKNDLNEKLQEYLKSYIDTCDEYVRDILNQFGQLEERYSYFNQLSQDVSFSLLRAIYYVPDKNMHDLTIKHQDKSLLSFVPMLKNECINFYKDDSKITYESKRNEMLIFGGLTLQKILNHEFQPIFHSVSAQETNSRIGLPLFYAPTNNFILESGSEKIKFVDFFNQLKDEHGFY